MQYNAKNGCTYEIEFSHGELIAFKSGKRIAQAETEEELKEILDHTNPETTYRYTGYKKEK